MSCLRNSVRAGMLALLLTVTLAACGVPVEDTPRPLPTGPATPSPAPTFTTPPQPSEDQVTLWFVRGGALVPAARTADQPLDAQDLIDLLVVGPTPQEKAEGLRSAVVSVVSGEPLVVTAEAANVDAPEVPADQVAIVLEPEFKELLSEEQVLVLGEVVTTVAVGEITEVLFVDKDGQELGVPGADGRLRRGAVSPADYASLIAE